MQKRVPLVVATVLLVSAAGCAGLRDIARAAFQTPELTVRSAAVDALDLEGATIGVTFDLANPNGFGLDLARVAWGLDMEGTRVAAGEMPGGLAIAAKATSPITIPVRVRFRDVPGIVSILTSGRDSVRYKVSGTAGVNTPIGVVDLPLAHEDTLRLPGLPGFSLEGISIRGVSLSTVALDLRLRVRNPNGFAIPPGRLDYALSIAGAEVASASEAALDKVAAGGSALVSIPVKVSLVKLGSAANALVSGGEVPVGLAGKAEVAGLPLPLDLRGNVPARR